MSEQTDLEINIVAFQFTGIFSDSIIYLVTPQILSTVPPVSKILSVCQFWEHLCSMIYLNYLLIMKNLDCFSTIYRKKSFFHAILTTATLCVAPLFGDTVESYTRCASEGGSYTLPGPSNVAYGADGRFIYQTDKTGKINFTNVDFGGDPVPGVSKSGYYKLLLPTNTPVGPTGFTWCANEWESYTLSSASDVAYGANGLFSYLTNQTGPVTFTNAKFGQDPNPGVLKAGFYKLLTPSNVPVGPAGFTWCASEWESYTLSAASDVAYGANGLFTYFSNRTGSVAFTNANFGNDPNPGVLKAGFYKLLAPPGGSTTYATWSKSGSFFVVTTPSGANIPAGVTETNFPLLLRLNSGNFDFSQTSTDGRDIRFSSLADIPLSYQIEQWDSVNATASIWIKIPTVTGNARQEIKMYWGKTGVSTESNGLNVFNSANGYASVVHMNESVTDAVGNLTATDTGTTLGTGMIGKCRYFPGGKGINFGSSITTLPSGSSPHSTQAWFRGTAPPSLVVAWGLDGPQSKLLVQFANPPRMNVGTWFSGGDVSGATALATSQWIHVVHTYESGKARLYVNGVLDGSTDGGTPMNIPTPSSMYIGGFYNNNNYSFVGEIDEVRISKVTRSANWIKMEYENQKPQQTLVGNLVRPGSTFAVAPTSVNLLEGTSTTLTAQAGGAQQVYWIEKRNGVETVLATNQFTLPIVSRRVSGNTNYTVRFNAIYASTTQSVDVPVTILENLPDPLFTLTGPATWDGRQTISIAANISNLDTMQTKGVANLTYTWTVNGVAVNKQISNGLLTLTRAQGNGAMSITLAIENGGSKMTQTKVITVQQPTNDAWVQRTPDANEKPVNNQFFARDPSGSGKIFYKGSQSGSPDTVFLKVYTTTNGEVLSATYRQALVNGNYSFAAPIFSGKVTYKVQYGTTTGGVDTPSGPAITNLVCGDAYIIEGQSNAEATNNSAPIDTTTDPWIRCYGLSSGWGNASAKGTVGDLRIGVWGLILAKRLSANYSIPICIINGAVGGTRIDEHRPNPAGHGSSGNIYSIYANLYNRIVGAKLTHGVRALLWHQGEQDQGSGGPDGDYDYKFYQQYFIDISAAWKQDFPNILNYYVFQIWPGACGDISTNDQLREVQRTLSRQYSNMRLMSTLGINPGSSCHYEAAGYKVFSDLISPLVEQDHYGTSVASVFTAANLQKASFTTAARNEVALEFDQNMAWNPGATGLLQLDGVSGKVASGSVTGKVVKLQLVAASTATTVTYLQSQSGWFQGNILYGSNGVAALTFANVSIGLAAPLNLVGSDPFYATWAASPGRGFVESGVGKNNAPLDDADHDGIANLLEFTLGSSPLEASQQFVPTAALVGTNWVFEYERNDSSVSSSTIQVVEYSSNFVDWSSITVPTSSSGPVTITDNGSTDHVKVTLPAEGKSLFFRLKVTSL